MLTQLFKSVVSSVTTVLRYVFSTRFLHTSLLIFMFLVSIVAAEEKYVGILVFSYNAFR